MNGKFLKNFSDKLSYPADIEGKKNSAEIRALREMADGLEKDPSFVGISFYGSTMKGYSNETSDLDFGVLFDGGDTSGTMMEAVHRLETIIAAYAQAHPQLKIRPDFADVSLSNLKYFLNNPNFRQGTLETLYHISKLFSPAIGKQLNYYRQRVVAAIKERRDQKFVEDVIRYLIWEAQTNDSMNTSKIMERANIRSDEAQEAQKHRDKLWEKRIRKFFV